MKTIRELNEARGTGFVAFLPMSYESAKTYDIPEERKNYIFYKGGGALIVLADKSEITLSKEILAARGEK